MAVKWDENTDYQALINQAVKNGDYTSAAKYEQQRNAKIADLNSSGTNQWNAQQSTNYAQYLGNGYQATGNYNDAGLSAADQAAIAGYKNQYYNAMSLNDQAGMDAAHAAAEAIRNQAGYSGGGDGSEYIALNQSSGYTMPTFSFDVSKPTFSSNYATRIDEMLNEILTRENFTFEDAPVYTDNYTGKITDMMSQIENREDFSYNAEDDALYQQYKTQYQREGNRSMNDTLAAAASNAGGMNSYAITAAQQANDYYAAQLTDKIPELQQLAYQMYLQDFEQDVTELNLLRSLGETEYNRWRDSLSDWRTDRSEAYSKYLDNIEMQVRDLGLLQDMDQTQYDRYRDTMSDWRDDRNFAYGQYRDEVGDYQWQTEFDYNAGQDSISNDLAYGQLTGTIPSTGQSTLANQQFGYQQEQDKIDNDYRQTQADIANSQWDKTFASDESSTAFNKVMTLLNSGAMPDASMLAAAGMTEAQAQTILAALKAESYSGGSSSGGGSGSSGSSGGSSSGSSGGGSNPTSKEVEETMKDVTIQGKPYAEYEAAAGNYADMSDMCEQVYKTQGKEAVLEMLREARSTGALNLTDYSTLFSRYRNKD